ncbi:MULTISPECIES: DUF4004 family protein [Turicibacter]|uniref:DUF4004 family protein n=2 Tax=Turicibacter sanguinis TaxID=154288 RepID=A0A9X5APF5_9FIRM|nr:MULTISPECIES: DUF4004 family protein [Turicibacter]EFF64864.1 conserved hypothetical protein [Turicibacter sanguinis PC909]EGC92408.1 hypothetical protein HMPREF9402_2213 [Turicibacter sp. HGF1]MBP3904526.1 DUF4004 family protein [Turicibacter sp.]MCU7190360.1 YhbD family protein [Turicibacter sanguinis]MCU7210802.1 YhbD family protein [Turicibacter sanguinis]
MEESLISKKELLQLTNISYGQLYRWKRKNLIPEEWFIKKSVSTGQETFFPRKEILERIERILELKDTVSLDELSEIFSPHVAEPTFDSSELINKKIVSQQAMQLYQSMTGASANLSDLKEVLMLKILQDYVASGVITFDEGKMIQAFLNQHFMKLTQEKSSLFLMRHLGLPFVIGAIDKEMLLIDEQDRIVLEIAVAKELSQIKLASLQ